MTTAKLPLVGYLKCFELNWIETKRYAMQQNVLHYKVSIIPRWWNLKHLHFLITYFARSRLAGVRCQVQITDLFLTT